MTSKLPLNSKIFIFVGDPDSPEILENIIADAKDEEFDIKLENSENDEF